MAENDSITPQPRRILIRLRRTLWGGWAAAVLFLPAAVSGDPADVVAEQPTIEISRAHNQYFSAIKLLHADTMRELFDDCLRQKIILVDQVCGLTDTQMQKLLLAGRGDIKQCLDRAAGIKTQFQLVQNDVNKVNELCKEALLIRRGLIVLSDQDSLFVTVLEKNLPADQSVRYQPLRDLYRMGGRARINERGADEGLLIILDGTAFADGDFVRLNNVPSLRCLSLSGTQVSDAGMAHLMGLTSLERLNLSDTQVTDAGLAHVERMTKLKTLELYDTAITDAGLSRLKELSGLRDLNLSDTQVTDAGLAHVEGLTNLERLNLDSTRVTDAGMVHLQGLNRLQQLLLNDTQVTDVGLKYLKGLTRLNELWLINTQATDGAVAELQQALPGLKINR